MNLYVTNQPEVPETLLKRQQKKSESIRAARFDFNQRKSFFRLIALFNCITWTGLALALNNWWWRWFSINKSWFERTERHQWARKWERNKSLSFRWLNRRPICLVAAAFDPDLGALFGLASAILFARFRLLRRSFGPYRTEPNWFWSAHEILLNLLFFYLGQFNWELPCSISTVKWLIYFWPPKDLSTCFNRSTGQAALVWCPFNECTRESNDIHLIILAWNNQVVSVWWDLVVDVVLV